MITTIGQLTDTDSGQFLKMWKTDVDPATRLLQDHRHGNFEIALVTAGNGIYHTVKGIFPIEPGDVFVFPSNEPHWILKILEQGLQIINLHFNHSFFYSSCSVCRKYPNLFYAHSSSFPTRIPAENAKSLQELIWAIQKELAQPQPEQAICIHSHLNLLFARLIRSYGYYLPEEGIHTAVEKLQESLRFIDENFDQDITLEQIASASNLSPHYFTRLFTECFHIRLWDHVLSKRIDAAKQLLTLQPDMTVLDVATQCGFHNTANFNRVFLRFTGLTPSEYRKGVPLH